LTFFAELKRRNVLRMAGLYLVGAWLIVQIVGTLAPSRGVAHSQLGNALLQKGDAQGALAELEQEKTEIWRMIGLPMAYHALGRKADSDAVLVALVAKYEKDVAYNIAYVYAAAKRTRRSPGSTRRSSTATSASPRS